MCLWCSKNTKKFPLVANPQDLLYRISRKFLLLQTRHRNNFCFVLCFWSHTRSLTRRKSPCRVFQRSLTSASKLKAPTQCAIIKSTVLRFCGNNSPKKLVLECIHNFQFSCYFFFLPIPEHMSSIFPVILHYKERGFFGVLPTLRRLFSLVARVFSFSRKIKLVALFILFSLLFSIFSDCILSTTVQSSRNPVENPLCFGAKCMHLKPPHLNISLLQQSHK